MSKATPVIEDFWNDFAGITLTIGQSRQDELSHDPESIVADVNIEHAPSGRVFTTQLELIATVAAPDPFGIFELLIGRAFDIKFKPEVFDSYPVERREMIEQSVSFMRELWDEDLDELLDKIKIIDPQY